MTPCGSCSHQDNCRVPHDLERFDRVNHRLQRECRQPLLQSRLDHYVHFGHCLVDAGIVSD